MKKIKIITTSDGPAQQLTLDQIIQRRPSDEIVLSLCEALREIYGRIAYLEVAHEGQSNALAKDVDRFKTYEDKLREAHNKNEHLRAHIFEIARRFKLRDVTYLSGAIQDAIHMAEEYGAT